MNQIKSKSNYGIVLFETTQSAIKAEKALIKANIPIKLIPVPRHISSNCGISIRFELRLMDNIKSVLSDNDIAYADILPL